MALNREQILQSRKAELKPFPVPEWKGDVYLRPMSALVAMWMPDVKDRQSVSEKAARMVIDCVCDQDGKPLFSDTPEDIALVRSLDLSGLTRVTSEIYRRNPHFSPNDVKGAVGNS